MTPRIVVTIGCVDMDAFQGREFHPEPEDLGKQGYVIEVYQFEDDPCDCDCEEGMACYTLQMEDGRVLEVISHEVAKVEWKPLQSPLIPTT